MYWIVLAARNVGRRAFRSLVTALGVAFSVTALVSLISFQRGYEMRMRAELDRLGAHILVVPKGCPYDAASIALHGASWPCYLKEDYLARVQTTNGVSAAAPILMNAVYDSSGNQSVYLGATTGLLGVKRGWRITGEFPVRPGDCLVGSSTAGALNAEIGHTINLPGLANRSARVSGILAPTLGADDQFIYVPLADAQQIFKRPAQLTHILVRLTDPDSLDSVVNELRGCDAGMDMNIVPLSHLFNTIQGLVNSTRVLLGCIAAIGLLVAGAGVSNAVLMAVTERTREIGVLRAVGASRMDVFRLVWLETLMICCLGGLGGLLLAAIGAGTIEHWLRTQLQFSPDGALLQIDPGVAVMSIAAAALLGTAVGLLPAWRAARLSPIDAIRGGA